MMNGTVCSLCSTPNCKFCGYGICTECKADYYLEPVDRELTCKSCQLLNCTHCSNNKACSECLPTFYVGPRSSCLPCGDGFCAVCPNNVCTGCVEGYSIRTNETVCRACADGNCSVCDSSGGCLTCKANMFLVDGECQSCAVSNCNLCLPNDIQSCEKCDQGYYVKDRLCHACLSDSCSACNP